MNDFEKSLAKNIGINRLKKMQNTKIGIADVILDFVLNGE